MILKRIDSVLSSVREIIHPWIQSWILAESVEMESGGSKDTHGKTPSESLDPIRDCSELFRSTLDPYASIEHAESISVHASWRWSSMSTFLMTNHPTRITRGGGRAEDRNEFEIGEWLRWYLENRPEMLSGTHPCGSPQSNSSHLLRIVSPLAFFQWQTSSWAVSICGMSPNTLDRQPFHFSRC